MKKVIEVSSSISKCFGVVILFYANSLFANTDLLSFYPRSSVVYEDHKRHQTYNLYAGPIKYFQEEPPGSEEGYRPESVSLIQGTVERKIFDHQEEDSALDIAKNMLAELKRKEFDIIYKCNGAECGDVAGWQLYLSDKIDGDIQGQYYIVARHPGKNSGIWYLVFYVNEFSNVPRSVIDVITTRDVAFDKYEIKKNRLGLILKSKGSVVLKGVNFAFDSAELTDESSIELDQVVGILQNEKDLKIEIVGHTDDLGEENYNMELSLARAISVKNYLVQQGGIQSTRLKTKGLGEKEPLAINLDQLSRSKNRRVEIHKID